MNDYPSLLDIINLPTLIFSFASALFGELTETMGHAFGCNAL
uniref:Uncharacterized protein n=1 Tax=Rhizophora mucronata TaxID=61149 RepID=A0A2P2J3G5_RHIMU